MKNKLKISILSLVCVLGVGFADAQAASSVRTLGGTGTYVSASSAANAESGGTFASIARGGSVRVSPTTSQTTTSSSSESSSGTRVVNVPRLSIGQYLGGGTSVSGGSSLRPQTPSTGSSSGGGTIDPGLTSELQRDVDQLKRDFSDLADSNDRITEALNEKQNILLPDSEGFIDIDQNTNEIYLNIEPLKEAISDIVGQSGREIEIGHDTNQLQWHYVDDPNWNTIISFADLAAYGNYAVSDDLADFVKADEMETAISQAITNAATNYATKSDLDLKADKADLDLKANVADVYTKSETLNKQEIADAIAEAVTGGTVDLTGYAKTDYVDAQLGLKADADDVSDLSGRVDLVESGVQALGVSVGTVQDTAEAAKTEADKANQALTTKAEQSDLTALETRVGANEASITGLNNKIGSDELETTSKQIVGAINEIKQKADSLPNDGNFEEMNQKITNIESKVDTAVTSINSKADTSYVDEELAKKANEADLGLLAKKSQVVDADIADGAEISKAKLSAEVRQSLANADSALNMEGAGPNMVLGTDENGDKVWYEIVDIKE